MPDEKYLSIKAWLNRLYHAEKKLEALEQLYRSDEKRKKHISEVCGAETEITQETDFSLPKYRKYLSEYSRIRTETENAIELLDNEILEAIFIYRYIEGFTLEQIAEKMNYSVITIKRRHKEGVQKLIHCDIV
ncbi:MAG: hypothetical protein IJA12_08335 [Oscillospiraceae bacterium]|nr:hypothetical protein [Oscillospiraceae bacterium]